MANGQARAECGGCLHWQQLRSVSADGHCYNRHDILTLAERPSWVSHVQATHPPHDMRLQWMPVDLWRMQAWWEWTSPRCGGQLAERGPSIPSLSGWGLRFMHFWTCTKLVNMGTNQQKHRFNVSVPNIMFTDVIIERAISALSPFLSGWDLRLTPTQSCEVLLIPVSMIIST